jgi:uracil-DNA glycosylase
MTIGRDDLAAHLEFFGALGVTGLSRDDAWRRRAAEPLHVPVPPAGADDWNQETMSTTSTAGLPEHSASSAQEALEIIRTEIGPACTRCKLHVLGRSQVVFGVGHPRARLMFVGEAPGEDEDRQGEPFVGRAGQLLTKIIEAIGLTRDQVYIANVIKCRPPGNRNPEPDEVATCEPFLFRQVDAIKPRVVVALGKFAAQSLLRSVEPISRIRGREFDFRGATLIPTYHPAYLLRNPSAKREVWDDMKKVRAILQDS